MSYYYHGSDHEFKVDDGIYPVNIYTAHKDVQAIEKLFEDERPESCQFPRIDCVFVTANFSDLDSVGAHSDFNYLVEIEDNVCEGSDLAWYSKAAEQLENDDIEGARDSARKYWSGEMFDDVTQSVVEYRTDECCVMEIL